MATIVNNEIITYNPAAVLNIFNNALTIEATKKAFRIKGIYLPGKGVNYGGGENKEYTCLKKISAKHKIYGLLKIPLSRIHSVDAGF